MSILPEIYRKCIHLFILFVPITYHYLGRWPSLTIFGALTTIFVSLDYLRRKNPKIKTIFAKILGPILRGHELTGDKLCGASWVGLATCINFFFFTEEIAVTSFVILAICDAMAALVGKSIPSQPFFEKSSAGSVAFFISGIIILLICGSIFDSRIWFYLFGTFALLCITVIEARPTLFNIDDNFSIPIGFSLIMTFFDLIWNYSY